MTWRGPQWGRGRGRPCSSSPGPLPCCCFLPGCLCFCSLLPCPFSTLYLASHHSLLIKPPSGRPLTTGSSHNFLIQAHPSLFSLQSQVQMPPLQRCFSWLPQLRSHLGQDHPCSAMRPLFRGATLQKDLPGGGSA